MNKIVLLQLAIIILLSCKVSDKVKSPEIFNSKYVKLIEDTNKMMLIQNVVIHYGDLYVEADSALLEKPKKRVTAFGVQKASFKGMSVPDPKKLAMIKYTKGDDRYYTD